MRGNVNMEGVIEGRGWAGKDTNKILCMKLSKLNFSNKKVRAASAVDNVRNREHACIIVNCSKLQLL